MQYMLKKVNVVIDFTLPSLEAHFRGLTYLTRVSDSVVEFESGRQPDDSPCWISSYQPTPHTWWH